MRIMTVHPGPHLTFVENFTGPVIGISLLEPVWPWRLEITDIMLHYARRGQLRGLTFDGELAHFTLTNAQATYRLLGPSRPGVFELECVSWSRDLVD